MPTVPDRSECWHSADRWGIAIEIAISGFALRRFFRCRWRLRRRGTAPAWRSFPWGDRQLDRSALHSPPRTYLAAPAPRRPVAAPDRAEGYPDIVPRNAERLERLVPSAAPNTGRKRRKIPSPRHRRAPGRYPRNKAQQATLARRQCLTSLYLLREEKLVDPCDLFQSHGTDKTRGGPIAVPLSGGQRSVQNGGPSLASSPFSRGQSFDLPFARKNPRFANPNASLLFDYRCYRFMRPSSDSR